MKKKKINADAALLEVARRHHTTCLLYTSDAADD